jgi:UDP-N-acetylglucosamine 2-epimerase (non-hydrolysing)
MKKKVFLIFGTRPEGIKMYPVYRALKDKGSIETKVIITSQHQEMLRQVIELFNIRVDYNLNVMEDRQTLTKITVKVLNGLKDIFEKDKPDLVLVHGDTTTTFSSALAAFYEKIPIAHVEAGLRTHDKFFPYPEEINRKLTDALTDLYFAPTENAKKNLLVEGVPEEKIFVTGNTVVDAVQEIVKRKQNKKFSFLHENVPFILVTAHRRENWGKPMENICNAINSISQLYNGKVKFIFSVHKNPIVRNIVEKILGKNKNVVLIEPMQYDDFLALLSKSLFILTDSGGIQEEAPSLNKPVLLLRNVTERPEAIFAGVVKIIGTDEKRIEHYIKELLDNKDFYDTMLSARNPFGDGKAGKKISNLVENYLLKGEKYGIPRN